MTGQVIRVNENYKNFLEAKIFVEEKDGGCNYANDLRRKYPEYTGLLNFTDIYRRIVNYRVKKYGTSRIGYSSWDDVSALEKKRFLTNKKNKQKRWKKR